MKLDCDQIEQFNSEGYLFIPGCFSATDASRLLQESNKVYAMAGEEVVLPVLLSQHTPTMRDFAYWAPIRV